MDQTRELQLARSDYWPEDSANPKAMHRARYLRGGLAGTRLPQRYVLGRLLCSPSPHPSLIVVFAINELRKPICIPNVLSHREHYRLLKRVTAKTRSSGAGPH